VTTLGEVADLQAGVGFPPKLQGRIEGAFPFAKVGDISAAARLGSQPLSSARNYVSHEDLKDLNARVIPAGSTLFAKIGEAIAQNFRVMAGMELLIDNNAMAAIPRDSVDPRYLYRFLQTVDMYQMASTTSVPSLRKSDLEGIAIPIPPLPGQRRIADILDRADDLRAQRRMALAKIDAFRDALVGDLRRKSGGVWGVVSLEDAYWFQEGPGVRKWQFTDEGVKLLNVGNILKTGQLDLARTTKHISNDEASGKYKHFLVDDGDLVIASSGIGIDTDGLLRTRGAFVSVGDLPLCMNTSTIRFKAREGISTLPYLQAWLSSYSFRSQISRLVTGSAQKNFGPSHLKQLTIELPPIDVQRTIENLALAASVLRSEHEAALAKLDELFASLQYRAFQGEL
jgi:type I restriction enzyme S subunit